MPDGIVAVRRAPEKVVQDFTRGQTGRGRENSEQVRFAVRTDAAQWAASRPGMLISLEAWAAKTDRATRFDTG